MEMRQLCDIKGAEAKGLLGKRTRQRAAYPYQMQATTKSAYNFLIIHFPTFLFEMIPAIQVVVGVISTAIFLHRFVFASRCPEEPPLIQGWIPWPGVALSYEFDPGKFLFACQRKYGNIFTLYMGGIRAHIISDPIYAIPAIYRNSKFFTFDPIRKLAAIKVMGLTEENQADVILYKELDALQITSLFSSDAVEEMTMSLIGNLEIVLDRKVKYLIRSSECSYLPKANGDSQLRCATPMARDTHQ